MIASDTRLRSRALVRAAMAATCALSLACAGCGGGGTSLPKLPFTRTRLVADTSGAATLDANLTNPWGLAFTAAGPLWVADNGTGLSTVYNASGAKQALQVVVNGLNGAAGKPTGVVVNETSAFKGDTYIFATEAGTIEGWQSGTATTRRVEVSASGAVFTGLAWALHNGAPRLFVADFHNARIWTFNTNYTATATTGKFSDPALPASFAPYNIAALNNRLYVAYAMQDAAQQDAVPGQAAGYIDTFTTDGVFVSRVVTTVMLNAPWGMVLAPSDYGPVANALLVGNRGDGTINAYNATTGGHLGQAQDQNGQPLILDRVGGLAFGNDSGVGTHRQLFYAAGPLNGVHGEVGVLTPTF